jgi:hypothetical protein
VVGNAPTSLRPLMKPARQRLHHPRVSSASSKVQWLKATLQLAVVQP